MKEFKCSKCGREFKSKSAKTNHEKKCSVNDGVSVVEIGFHLLLKDAFKKDDEGGWDAVDDMGDGVGVKVVSREVENGSIWLICHDKKGGVWAVSEDSSNYEVLNDEDRVAQADSSYEKEQLVFRQAVISFDSTNEKKKLVVKEHEKNNKIQRPIIIGFLDKYGKESGEGKQDQYVADFGYVVHNVRTPGKIVVDYDDAKIIEWLEDNDHDNCVEKRVNVAMWEALKASGRVPAEFIRKVESPRSVPDSFSLVIKKSE